MKDAEVRAGLHRNQASARRWPAVDSVGAAGPLRRGSGAPAGVRATRFSSVLIARATPIRKTRGL